MTSRPSSVILRPVACLAAGLISTQSALAGAPTFTSPVGVLPAGLNVDARSASFADMDNDGDLDLFFQGAAGAMRLLRNQFVETGTATYVNVSNLLPSRTLGSSWSACWGDYDGDGDVDVFVGQTNSSTASGDVLRNDMPAGFTNVSAAVGLNDPGFHQNIGWCDIDGDLDLDLVIGMEGPEKHQIYVQGAGGLFSAMGASAGFQEDYGTKAYGMAMGDTDDDGDIDVYISTCAGWNDIRNNFYESQVAQTGTLTFVDIADANGTQDRLNSYGAEFHDLDDDGDLDLFLVGADQQPTKIFRNDGNSQFTDVDSILGQPVVPNYGGDLNGGRCVDYDNDGDLDLFSHDHKPLNGVDVARKLFRNDGNWSFVDVTVAEGLHAANEGAYDSAWGDFDNDGDMDLCAPTDSGSVERFFVSSASTNGNHWLQLRLRGTTENTTAIGAKVFATLHFATPQQRTLRRDANTNAGTFNQSDLPVHFGLGTAVQIDQLRVVWPNRREQDLCNLAVDRYLSLDINAIEGDFDADGAVGLADLNAFVDCYSGPTGTVSPTSPACIDACSSAFDADANGTIDLADYAALQPHLN